MTPKTQFYTLKPSPSFKNTLTNKMECPTCEVETIWKKPGKLFGDCVTCGLRVMFFMPHEAQALAHILKARTVLMFSGVSTGKTTLNGWTIIEHALTTPGAAIYVLAQTSEQRDKNVKDQVLRQFIDEENDLVVENYEQWTFHNGSRIYFYTSDDHQKLKSANATCVWLVEAQGFKVELYFEAQQRARAQAAKTFKRNALGEVVHIYDKKAKRQVPVVLEDRALILVEGNIDPNSWIREFGVMQSHTIIGTPNTYHYKLKGLAKPVVDEVTKEVKDIVTFIMSPFDNYYNSPTFLKELKLGKPKRWINQEVYGDLSLEGGLVFPNIQHHIIDPKEHETFFNDGWEWIEGMDFGGANIGNDPTAYLLAKYNHFTNEVIVMAEYYRSGSLIAEDVRAIYRLRQDFGFDINRSRFFVCDPSGRRSLKTDIGKKDTISFYKQGGLTNLKPAYSSKGANTFSNILVTSGIKKIKELVALDNLKINKECTNLISELLNYRIVEPNVAAQVKTSKRPSVKLAGKDHAIDALRYMISELPYIQQNSIINEIRKEEYDKMKDNQEIKLLRKNFIQRSIRRGINQVEENRRLAEEKENKLARARRRYGPLNYR